MATRTYEKAVQEDLNVGVGAVTITNPAGGSLTGTQIGIHSLAVNQLAASYSPASVHVIAAGSSVTFSVTVTGAALGDFALSSSSVTLANLMKDEYVSAANTVTIVLSNLTGASVTFTTGTFKVLVFKSRSA